jgi:hypothetical protein
MAFKARRRRERLKPYPCGPTLQALQECRLSRGRHRAVDTTERVSISPGFPFWPEGSLEQVHDAGQPLELILAAQAPKGFSFRR